MGYYSSTKRIGPVMCVISRMNLRIIVLRERIKYTEILFYELKPTWNGECISDWGWGQRIRELAKDSRKLLEIRHIFVI